MRLHRHVARLAVLSLAALGLGAGATALGTSASAASGTYASPTSVAINTRTPSFTNTTSSTIATTSPPTTGSSYPSQIVVAGQPGLITDVNVSLNLTHTFARRPRRHARRPRVASE